MKNLNKTLFKIYFEYIKRYKISLALILIFIPISSLVDVVVPIFYKGFFDELASTGDVKVLYGFLLKILITYGIGWMGWRFSTFATSYFQTKVMADLSNKCFESLHRHSINFFNNSFVGSLVKKANKFTYSFETIADLITWEFIPLVTTLVLSEIVLFTKSRLLAFVILIWLILFTAINYFFSIYKLKHDIKRTEKDSEVTATLADTITNQLSVKLFNGFKRENKNFQTKTNELHLLRMFSWNLANYAEAIQGALVIFLEVGLFYISVKLWKQGILTIGDFVLIQSYILNVFMRIWRLGRMIRRFYEATSDAKEMVEIFETPYEIQDSKDAVELKVSNGKIEFKDIYFNYNQTRKIIDNFNLSIKAGEKIGIVGPSGSGKSTLVNLLLRSYDVEQGKILIDDQKITKVTKESLWKNITFVPQDTVLFHRTLLENIKYGNPKATDNEVIQASGLAYCHDFIEEFQDKYNTLVGERGIKLSGGERQRIAIARAILKNAPILVLDEATSSLDSHSEELIQKALDSLMKDKTVIVIAHRLSTIMKMDRIVVLENGRIIESGNHQELLEKRGLYEKLWSKQVGGFIA